MCKDFTHTLLAQSVLLGLRSFPFGTQTNTLIKVEHPLSEVTSKLPATFTAVFIKDTYLPNVI